MTDRIVTQAETSFGDVEVVHISWDAQEQPVYEVRVDGKVKHPEFTAEDAMRALSHYLQSEGYKLQKLSA